MHDFFHESMKRLTNPCIPVGIKSVFNVDNLLIKAYKVDQPGVNIDAKLLFQRCQPTTVSTLINSTIYSLAFLSKSNVVYIFWRIRMKYQEYMHDFS